MTDSTPTTAQAASNGGTATETSTQDTPAQPARGLDRLRDDECYHLTGLVTSALYETEHLIRQVHDKAQDRFFNHHKGGSDPLDAEEITRLLGEAYQCSLMASTYIDKAAMRWLDRDAETPF
jgi:hypothetical protein